MNKTVEKVAKLLIGEKVKRLYSQQALSQKEIAAKASVDVKTIQRLENGETAKGDTLQRVAKALDVPVTEFSMLLGLDNGSIAQMSLPELNGLKMSLSKLVESRKINREEYVEMRELIEMVQKSNTPLELPPLPPPPENFEPPHAEPKELLEELSFIDAIKRVLTENKLWVKYAPADKNQPTLAHKLRQWGFISQPYFCKTESPQFLNESYQIGLFKRGFPSHIGLYLVINNNRTNEGIVVQLWPYHVSSSDYSIIFLYRSLSGNESVLNVNMREFIITHGRNNHYAPYSAFFSDLLDATRNSNSNFEMKNCDINNAWGYGFYYNPALVIKTGEQPPIHLPWTIDLYRSMSLKFNYPIGKPMLFVRKPGYVSVNIALGERYDHNDGQRYKTPHLTVIWPQFSEFATKFLAFWRDPKYKKCNNSERIDLAKLTDQLKPEPQSE